MRVYAIMETGGRQYRIAPGDEIVVEKLPGEAGQEIQFDRLLMVVEEQGSTLVGAPYVAGARAVGTVVQQERGPKILVFKYKPKVNYRRRQGHRQDVTRVKVDRIEVV